MVHRIYQPVLRHINLKCSELIVQTYCCDVTMALYDDVNKPAESKARISTLEYTSVVIINHNHANWELIKKFKFGMVIHRCSTCDVIITSSAAN